MPRRLRLGVCLALLALAPDAPAVEGVVRSHEGEPLDGVEIRRLAGADDPSATSGEPLAEPLRTGPDGRFQIPGEETAMILEVRGDQGAGRVRWHPRDAGPLSIAYPVRETIVLLHDNDQHFDFNGADQFQKRVDTYRQEFDDVFLLNAGDIVVRHPDRWIADGESFAGDVLWYRDRACAIVETMNRIGYDAMTLGNHELAAIKGYTHEALEKAQFPLLATNVKITTDRLPEVESQVVLRTSTGRTIAVIGLTLGAGEGVEILDRHEVAAEYTHLADEHDLVVALTHIGYGPDRQLAERFPYFDLIIGGHSHTLLEEAVIVNSVLVAQAGGNPHAVSREHPKYLGAITVTLENGQVIEKAGQVEQLPVEARQTERVPHGTDN